VIPSVTALGAVAWVALLLAAPWLPGWAGAALYGLGSVICHQIPERSFHLGAAQLPVCARCLGLYGGAALGGAAGVIAAGALSRRLPLGAFTSPGTLRSVAIAAAVPTVATVLLETAGAWLPSNITRALAGVPLGAVLGLVVVSALATLHYGGCPPPRPNGPTLPPPSI
jgi:uncharacterized membrane protein